MKSLSFQPFPNFETDRLFLRRMNTADLEAIFALKSSAEVAAFQDRPLHLDTTETAAYMDKMNAGIDSNASIFWVLALKETDECIGTVCLWNFSNDGDRADLGYELLPAFQGAGYMREAVERVLDYGFGALSLQAIDGVTHRDNASSVRVLEKLDFHLNSDFVDGDEIMYTIKKRS
ncbi:N-acetyltransferase GCN5 [Listeria weihenstephanensis FSL R9-0317]|uniref:N-acetyltransferase domain-containing protein n=1 Tax=Listeria weihenstephanensis TaxID=1006155 RepID=A0A1S7FXV7_9LIST|nr:GNAT family N-acetyltransferase [Listeria weihenstephanensis]AQY52274.1 hypothetical protein UE46_15450 [Listeria weihenstephanensis]EUJ38641.1 N-acetyltransferase GCN5 [Listeria weihenstephanensis FSL R9-0317]